MTAESNANFFDADASRAVTSLANSASNGDPLAAAELLPLVYDQLRRLARDQIRAERPGQTLQATALVHEAYLRLLNGRRAATFKGRWHFYAAAAEAMRRILVDSSRARRSVKRGGCQQRVDLEHANPLVPEPPEDLVALDEALEAFEGTHPEKAQLVKFRYFAGLSVEEAAQALGISVATANRHWAYAKAWLYRRVKGSAEGVSASDIARAAEDDPPDTPRALTVMLPPKTH